jgi:histidine ammonia-lyase
MIEIGNPLKLATLRDLSRGGARLAISKAALADIDRGAAAVAEIVRRGQPAYGVNTGFGRLAQTHIPTGQLELLQRNLVLSHAVGVGNPLPAAVVRLMLALKIASLARGFSGVRRELVDALVRLYNADVLPRVPAKGSVGASGDLAPLAHLAAALLGVGEVECEGRVLPATEGLKLAGLAPITLAAKEGLALLNGTQTSTALALWNLFAIDTLYATALVAGALSVDAAEGSASPFDARIHELRGHPGQIAAAAAYRELLANSPINSSHRECGKVQDPYSLRCQPQVMGACSDQIEAARVVLMREAN